mgnify:CR=1 FL=1
MANIDATALYAAELAAGSELLEVVEELTLVIRSLEHILL